MKRFFLILAVLAVSSVAGCATTKPPTPVVPPAVTASTSVDGVRPEPPSGASFVPVAMPWLDGGSMLWPLLRDIGARDDWGNSGQRYGFIDVSAREVVPPRYFRFDYCLTGGRPARAVATRDDVVDVIDLDGTVTRTIKVSEDIHWRVPEDDPHWQTLWCRDNKTVAIRDQGIWAEYDLDTGAKLAKDKTVAKDAYCAEEEEEPDSPDPKLPAGYTNYRDGWASDGTDDKWPTKYLNIETSAVVKVSGREYCMGDSYRTGDSGYLFCWGGAVDTVYDKNGKLTELADVSVPWLGDCGVARLPDSPYLWALAGSVKGYIDQDGVWHYQESAYSSVDD